MIPYKSADIYHGMFQRCALEFAIDGFSVFDAHGVFVGMMCETGFAYSEEYEHRDKIIRELHSRDIPFWGYETGEEIKIAEIESHLD